MNIYLNGDIESMHAKTGLASVSKIYRLHKKSSIKLWLWGILALIIIIMLLPWTQNIRAKGTITTLRQEQRPQQVNTIIAGTALKWYVKEGDFVNAGDTLLQLGEVKVDYFDPLLLQRTKRQIEAKQESIEGYIGKANATVVQSRALSEGQQLKLQWLDNKIAQQQLKVQTDEAELLAANNELDAYKRQIQAGHDRILYNK